MSSTPKKSVATKPAESGCPVKKLTVPTDDASAAAHRSTDAIQSGCPVKKIGNNADEAQKSSETPQSGTSDSEYLNYSSKQTKELFDALRTQTYAIEDNIAEGETAVLLKDEVAFLMRRHELAISNMINAHATDLQKHKETLAASLAARFERKKAKKEARISIRASKKRDQIIQVQEKSAQAASRIRESIAEKRAAFDSLNQHMYEIHDKQRKNMIQSQERKYQNEKLLVDLETRHLKEEVRSTILKKFQVRQNHQGHLNKRINDNLRELQLMELRHVKEKFELDMVCYEEIGSREIAQENQLADVRLRQMNELHTEKENVLAKHEAAKATQLQVQHTRELKQLAYNQKIALRQLKIKHDQILESKKGYGSAPGSKKSSAPGSKMASHAGSAMNSRGHSRAGSSDSIEQGDETGSQSGSPTKKKTLGGGLKSLAQAKLEEEEDQEDFALENGSGNLLSHSLQALILRHKEELKNLETSIKQEINDCHLSFEAKQAEMEEQQNQAVSKLLEDQQREIEELRAIQEKEIKMEESMHDSEMKMLVERRILNSVLETVADGIINITPIGVIVRFNHAAEVMFGYKAKEVIGVNITKLMPERFSRDHHIYLNNYLTTGVKKVIGIGRRVFGLKKDGSEFPLHLSISELKEDGEHLFTGIARDLTEEVAEEEKVHANNLLKQAEVEKLSGQLQQVKQEANAVLAQVLPPTLCKQVSGGAKVDPQHFQSASVLFLDVVGFSSITATLQPLETVHLLNDLNDLIEKVVAKYDAFKVETVGDTYMIAAGVPKANATHAAELATMALHLLAAIDQFVYASKTDLKISVRIGIHSGPLVAGVIGTKLPRYCLFGDTVNTASRVESTGQAGKIVCTEATHALLKKDGSFGTTARGDTDIKGKGMMKTYWIDSKLNFEPAKLLEATK